MREILFRGKRIDNGKWIEGFYLPIGEKTYIICEAESDCTDGENTDLYATEWYEVDSETVCQYTDLTDKNGKKIFDGDILSAHLDDRYPEDITYVQVTWDGFSWCIRESTEDDVISEHDCNIFEVCGNIFDNPELIGE